MEHRSKMNILYSTLLILINKTTANVSNKVPGLEFFRLTAINTHNWSMDILSKSKVVDQLYICVCFTWIIRFMGPALYFCFIKKKICFIPLFTGISYLQCIYKFCSPEHPTKRKVAEIFWWGLAKQFILRFTCWIIMPHKLKSWLGFTWII